MPKIQFLFLWLALVLGLFIPTLAHSAGELAEAFDPPTTLEPPPVITKDWLMERARNERTDTQLFMETFGPAVISAVAIFPFVGMSLDHLAHQKMAKSLKDITRGFGVHMFATLPDTLTFLGVGALLTEEDDSPTSLLINGWIAGAASGIVSAPIDLTLTQQRYRKSTFWETYNYILKQRGYAGFATGMSSIALRNMVSATGFFWVPPMIVPYLPKISEDEGIQNVFATAIGGAVMGAMNQPFEASRAAIQRTIKPVGERNMSIPEAWSHLIKKGGVRELWRGAHYGAIIVGSPFVMIALAQDWFDDRHTEENYQQLLKEYGSQVVSGSAPKAQPHRPLFHKNGASHVARQPGSSSSKIQPLWSRIQRRDG